MKKGKQKIRRRKIIATAKKCAFCEAQKDPTFADVETLQRYITERGKIISRLRSGVCAKHQRRLSLAVKHARHLALLPFLVQI